MAFPDKINPDIDFEPIVWYNVPFVKSTYVDEGSIQLIATKLWQRNGQKKILVLSDHSTVK